MNSAFHESELLIKEQHLDAFGHVNNTKYLELFEQARWDFITENGFTIETVKRVKQGPVILEAVLSFRRELVNRQLIRIRSRIDSYERKIGKMTQIIQDEQGQICCEAKFVFGLFDLEARKLIEPTPEWLQALGLQAR